MSTLLYVEDSDQIQKINIDELYEKQQRHDLRQLSIFNKILNRLHKRITITSRTKRNERFVWFTVPEYIFGEPLYDQAECIGYIVSKLTENGFHVRYIHPNTLFVSWEQWVPSYVRKEIKKKTGKIIDEKGTVIDRGDESHLLTNEPPDINDIMLKRTQPGESSVIQKEQKQFISMDNYKPTGKLIYNPELFDKIHSKMGNDVEKKRG